MHSYRFLAWLLFIRICTLIVSWHDYFLSGYVLLLFPDMITFYQDMSSNCFLTWLLFIRICTLIVSWLDYFLSGYVLLLFPDVIPFVWCDLDMISVWLACVGKQMAWHWPRPGLGTGWSCSWCPMGHGWSRGQHGICPTHDFPRTIWILWKSYDARILLMVIGLSWIVQNFAAITVLWFVWQPSNISKWLVIFQWSGVSDMSPRWLRCDAHCIIMW